MQAIAQGNYSMQEMFKDNPGPYTKYYKGIYDVHTMMGHEYDLSYVEVI